MRIGRGDVRCRRHGLSWIAIAPRRVVVARRILVLLSTPVRGVISSSASISLASSTSSSGAAGIPVLTMRRRRMGGGLGDWRGRRRRRI